MSAPDAWKSKEASFLAIKTDFDIAAFVQFLFEDGPRGQRLFLAELVLAGDAAAVLEVFW